MRYWIFGLLLLAGCNMTPEQRAQFSRDMDTWGCANSLSFGSISVGAPERHIPYAQAMEWCKAMQRGQPYVSPQANVAPSYRAPVYDCDRVGNTVECRPR